MKEYFKTENKSDVESFWKIADGFGFFLNSSGEKILVARAGSLPPTKFHQATQGGHSVELELRGIDYQRDIALLSQRFPTFDRDRVIRPIKIRNLSPKAELQTSDVMDVLRELKSMEQKTERTYRDYPPQPFEMMKAEFVQLQQAAKKPFGVFSRDDFGNLYEGWSTEDRVLLKVPNVWRYLARLLPETNNFFLRGFEVVTYRRKYQQGYTVPYEIAVK